jgi:hypothetical protein
MQMQTHAQQTRAEYSYGTFTTHQPPPQLLLQEPQELLHPTSSTPGCCSQ